MSNINRGHKVRTNASQPLSRDQIARGHTGKTPLWDAVNYPSETDLNSFEWHRIRYERQAEAKGLIDRPAEDTWGAGDLDISDDYERDGDDGEDTEFEQAVRRLLDGDATRRQPIHRFIDADKQATLGEYSIICFGFNDGEDPREPVDDGQLNGLDDLNFIFAYDQERVQSFETNNDITSERFGLPETYNVEVSDGQTETFHHSRVVHIPQGGTLTSDDLHGEFALKSIAHPLVNIDKIQAAGAEGYWRGAYQGLVIRPPTDENGVPMVLEDQAGEGAETDSSEVQKKIDRYERNMDRVIATTAEIESIGTQVSSPLDHLESQFRSISSAWNIPMSILMGNERGDMATEEDRAQYHEFLSGRRMKFDEPLILRPVFDRLIVKGVLPEPQGDGYTVNWPPLEELTEMEKADIFATRMKALKDGTSGQPTQLVTWAEVRNKWMDDWNAARGSEEPDDLEILDTSYEELVAQDDVDESSMVGASNVAEQGVATDGGRDDE